MTVPTKRDAFLVGRAQIWTAAAGTALPTTLNTSTNGLIAVNEQTVTLPTSPTSGDFTLTYNGVTTAALTFDETAADVETALNGLSTLGTGQVEVTGDAGGPFTVAFVGSIGQSGYPYLLSITDSTVGGTGTASVARVRDYLGWTEGDASVGVTETFAEHMVNEVRSAVDHSPDTEAGTFECTLAEATLARWNQAMSLGTYTTTSAGATQTEYEKLGFGDTTEVDPVQVVMLGKNRNGYNQMWVLHRVVRQLNAGPTFTRSGKVTVPVNGVLQHDPTQNAGYRLWTAYNITGLPTS